MPERREKTEEATSYLGEVLGISLIPDMVANLEESSQGSTYKTGYFMRSTLKSKPAINDCYLFVNPLFPAQSLDGIYSFIIQKTKEGKEGFELSLGQISHYFVAQKALSVVAAGDIYFTQDFITKITDQSGCYHLKPHAAPDYEQKRRQALLAMQACGLPMAQFQSFQEPMMKPLMFSSRPITPATMILKSPLSHPYKALTPQESV